MTRNKSTPRHIFVIKKKNKIKKKNRFELTSTRVAPSPPSVRRKQQTPGSTFRPGTSIGNRHRHDNDDDDYYCQLLSSLTTHNQAENQKIRIGGGGIIYNRTPGSTACRLLLSRFSHTPSSTRPHTIGVGNAKTKKSNKKKKKNYRIQQTIRPVSVHHIDFPLPYVFGGFYET
jgi:hypothetical protein